ncbi:uncharacterized protein B0H64DRAFT_173147 [Chaetomium fimeti]|uniref:C2H2-type domain-containing protein n=1 Tax=Chaetomium fimeti TaxID=1854472 RepID=A0AAE0HC48_9PEZI|nr:hypothetical protein B0H64DRAFT_173147 [Chaetomium fimeti]
MQGKNGPSPGTPPSPDSAESPQSKPESKADQPHVQVPSSTTAGIAALIDDFSRFRPQDSENSDDMSQQAAATEVSAGSKGSGDGIGIRPSSPASDATEPPHGATDAGMSADEQHSTSSGEGRLGGDDRDDGGQSEMIDRIMKSFCASLDSKIAAITEPKARPGVKEEGLGMASFAAATTVAKDAAPSAPQKPARKIKFRRGPGDVQPEPTAPGFGMGMLQPSSMASLFTPMLAAAHAPVPPALGFPSTTHRSTVPQNQSPPPPSSSVTFTPLRSRQQLSTPSPPPPPPQAPIRYAHQAGGLPSPPLTSTPPSRSIIRPLGFSRNQEVSVPGVGPGSAADISGVRVRSVRAREAERRVVDPSLDRAQHVPDIPTASGGQVVPEGSDLTNISRREPIPASEMRYRQIRRAPRHPTVTSESTTPSAHTFQGARSGEIHHQPTALDGSAQLDGQLNWSASELRREDVNAEANAPSIEEEVHLPFVGYTLKNFKSQPLSHQSMPPLANLRNQDMIPSVQRYGPETFEGWQAPQTMKRAAGPEPLGPDTSPEAPQETDGDGRRKKPKRASLSAGATSEEKGTGKFACPYFQRNPKKYRKWTSCPGPGWDEVHRVKTHLYRRHPLPIQCPRCWETFKAEAQLQLHLQQDPPCSVQRNRTLQEGFTKDQEKKLRSRKKGHADMTDVDKWREIYMILFPDDEQSAIPSPYYNESEDGGENQAPNGYGELEDYATFIRREMPTLVRRELETLFREEFQDIEERVRPRIADIVMNLQPRLLGLYQQSQMPLSEYGPQQHTGATSGSEPTLTPSLSQSAGSATGSGPDSTPDMAFGVDNGFTGTEAQLGFYGSGLDEHWNGPSPGSHMQPQAPQANIGLGLNWDSEFNNLLNPALFFMPPPGGLPMGY